jgi:valyl-tRNA synthetase
MDSAQLPKWGVAIEEEIAQELAGKTPVFDGSGDKPVWSIDTPPPYPSGKWHIGAVAGYSLIDMIARSKRMEGYDVLFPWGTDRNGINIEFTVEKASKKPMQFWDRAEFNAACHEAISVHSEDMKRIARRIGLSADIENGYETDSPQYRAFSQAQFLKLFEEGLIVEELRPNTFDPKLGTTIADAEVFYEERKTRLNHVTWTVKETGEEITISTTRPELICAARQVLVHPDNEETKHLIGKTAVLPVVGGHSLGHSGNAEVPIAAHTHVKTDFGSGVMMVCSYGDQADVQMFRELELEPIAAIGTDGKMTDAAGIGSDWPEGKRPKQDNGQPLMAPGLYADLKVEPARTAIIADLEAEGLLPEFDTIDQKFPVSERSKAAVEVISIKEWYVKQTHCTDDLRAIAKDLNFVPDKHRQLLLDWIETVSIDWPISRRRYYHTEIPLWLLQDADGNDAPYVVVPSYDADATEHTYLRPWADAPPAGSKVVHRDTREPQGSLEEFQAAHPELIVVGEQKVFDTWMDSSVSNLYILKDHMDKPWHADHVCSVRPQGRDIVRTWLYYTLLKSHLLKGRAGFENAWVHGMGMDKSGRKMSKSVGNVIDPDDILKKFGSDAFRLWIAGECTIGDDFRIDEQKIQGTGKFIQKLVNVVNFVRQFEAPNDRPADLRPVDEWILGELDAITKDAVAGYAAIDFFGPANKVRSFVWNTFAPHYVEMVKARAYAGDVAAAWTLNEVARRVLALLAPLAPFVTHFLGNRVYGIDVHAAGFPEPLGIDAQQGLTEAVEAFNGRVWKAKQDAGQSLAAPIDDMDIPELLVGMADEFTSMHKLGMAAEPEAT